MDAERDPDGVVGSLADWLARLMFVDLDTDEVTTRILGSVAEWADGQGWRVYRRATSVFPLPPPYQRRYSVLDIACARPAGPPIVIEVDRSHRQRTVDKLVAEAGAGRVAVLVRWGTGPAQLPSPVHLVTCHVTSRRGPAGNGRLHSHVPVVRPAPEHSGVVTDRWEAVILPVDPDGSADQRR